MVIYRKNMMEAMDWAHNCLKKISEEGIYILKKDLYQQSGETFLKIEYWDHLPRWINIGEDKEAPVAEGRKPNLIVKMPTPHHVTIKEANFEEWLAIMQK